MMDRRTFLKIAGMGSMAFAAGCSSDPDRKLFSLVNAPDDMVTGQPTWYATTCRECPAGCGMLAKNREGRVIKLEGNPLHPVNQGALCMRGQAALQGLYDPDRIRGPLLKENDRWTPIGQEAALDFIRRKTAAAARKGPDRIQFWTEVLGAPLHDLAAATLKSWNAAPPTVFEPFGYDALKAANQAVFGIDGLFAYRMEDADVLVSFGADFLETWLSPVFYARQFKAMHRVRKGRKGLFFHVGPFQSLTGSNADAWVACRPDTEALIALALIQIGLDVGRAAHLPYELKEALEAAAARYPKETMLARTGIPEAAFNRMARRLFQAQNPLVLGTGAGAHGPNGYATNLAVNILNTLLNPDLPLLAFEERYRVETAAPRAALRRMLDRLGAGQTDLFFVYNANPVYALPDQDLTAALADPSVFVVSFSNVMDETTALADLILPVQGPLEAWDAYEGVAGAAGILQPVVGRLNAAPALGDVLLATSLRPPPATAGYKTYLPQDLGRRYGGIERATDWIDILQAGGRFAPPAPATPPADLADLAPAHAARIFGHLAEGPKGPVLIAAPSIRYFDGRGANKSWLNEIPDPLTTIAWQTAVLMHPETAADLKVSEGDLVRLAGEAEAATVPVYPWEGIVPGALVMTVGQGHSGMGRYARDKGANPFKLLGGRLQGDGPVFMAHPLAIQATGQSVKLAMTAGSRVQHERKIALRTTLEELRRPSGHAKPGLTMWDFPLTLPLPEGYDAKRDFYLPHDHAGYRWAMVVDLDRCIGCNACAAACYAENNLGVVLEERMAEGREMAWLQIQRYLDAETGTRVTFLPMLCQHCDNAPCEPVCPVYAPHHGKEGLNNQIYNRCIGTRFCSQNCPYKVRRFNWYTWQWPEPLNEQLNPDVTVRAKGVMEKCSFCIQRIKDAHNVAKNEKRAIRDGEVVTACMQTCPTGALTFGSLMDPDSRVRRLVDDPRAYQVMGYLNTKPAVIYLKKVVQEV